MRFNSDKFSLNGVHCSEKQVSLLWGDDQFIEYGLTFDKPVEFDGLTWKDKNNEQPDPIKLNIIYDVDNLAKKWTKEKLEDIESWLITDDFVPFVSDDDLDVTYYLKTVNILRRLDANMKGWLEVEFQPISNFGYINQNIIVRNTARFLNMKSIPSLSIINKSNLNKPYYPIIKISNLNGEISIVNQTTDTTFTLEGEGNITIDNKMRTIFDDKGNNLLMSSNRKWIFLEKGVNKIQVMGDCNISFISKYEVRI